MEIQVVQRANTSGIVSSYGSRLAGFIRKRVKRLEDAEDILQELFYQLPEADLLMIPIDELAAWLFTVARNRIADLPTEQREVFELTEFEGLPFKEIAQINGVPVNTLISRKSYAVLYLRERLTVLYDELINF